MHYDNTILQGTLLSKIKFEGVTQPQVVVVMLINVVSAIFQLFRKEQTY